MQTAKKHVQHALTGFELTKIVLHNLKHFGLKPQTKTVLWVLIDCYNPENGSVVFPSMEYIATEGAMGLTSAKEGIKELINKGLIIKSKRGKIRGNYNKYLLTPKVQNPTLEQPENELLKQSETDRFMIRTNKERKNKKQTTKENVVVSLKTFSSKKTITLDDVPEIIKNNPKVDKPCAYWASLSEEVKAEKIKEQKKNEEKARKREFNRKKALKQKQEEAKKLQEEASKPTIFEGATKEEALDYCARFGSESNRRCLTNPNSMVFKLVEKFSLNIDEICSLWEQKYKRS